MKPVYETRGYQASDRAAFKEMVRDYYGRELKMEFTEEDLEDFCDRHTQPSAIPFIAILTVDGIPKGFCLYQIDTPGLEWCEKEGWGCINEFYIAPDVRKCGYGRMLAGYAERELNHLPIPGVYLTADEAVDFWLKVGYEDTGEVCARNEGRIMEKHP